MEPERKKSTHKVEVVRVRPEKHPNGDNLLVAQIFGGYTCVMAKNEWEPRLNADGEVLAAYLPPDSIASISREEFAFLAPRAKNGQVRVKAMKLRGIVSYGLLVPAPQGSQVGDDVSDQQWRAGRQARAGLRRHPL
jgi:hypothetical protein